MLSQKAIKEVAKEWARTALITENSVQALQEKIRHLQIADQIAVCEYSAQFVKSLSPSSDITLFSTKQDWITPPYFLDIVRNFGPIALDPCANPHSFVRARYAFYGGANHLCGLSNSWWVPKHTVCFVNPPYGRKLTLWVAKIAEEYGTSGEARGSLIALVPARTGTGYWERFLWPFADAVCFWHGGTQYPSRMKFYELDRRPAKSGSTFDAAVVYFGDERTKFQSIFEKFGKVQLCN